MIPGLNILGAAFTAIAQQQIEWYEFSARGQDSAGYYSITYKPPVTARASVQPVNFDRYKNMGLDMAKNYIEVWAELPVDGLQRGEAADQIKFGGRTFDVEKVVNWYAQDGWSRFICVEVQS